MANHKVSFEVIPWAHLYRARILVDHYEVERGWFDDFRVAERWAKAKSKELQAALAQ